MTPCPAVTLTDVPAAALLDLAARRIRDDWTDAAAGGGRTAPTMLAMADWLTEVADILDGDQRSLRVGEAGHAVTVARAYLGEQREGNLP